MSRAHATRDVRCRCGRCQHFLTARSDLERLLPGLTILSSAYGDTFGNQGLCQVHQRLLTPDTTCDHFTPEASVPTEGQG